MKRFLQKSHAADLLFTISLFCVFAISALAVTASGAGIYQRIVHRSESDYTLYTALTYVEQKAKNCNLKGGIDLKILEGQQVLCLYEQKAGVSYTTYIYQYEGSLCELFLPSDRQPLLDLGTPLLELSALELGWEDGLLSVTAEDAQGNRETLYLHSYCAKEE